MRFLLLIRWVLSGGSIDRVLPAFGTRQYRQRQHMRFVKAGHGPNGGDGQRVPAQRAGHVSIQRRHRCGFINGGKAGIENSDLLQRARPLLKRP